MGLRRRPVVIELAQTAAGPPGVVWDLITDWEHQGDWMLEADGFAVTSSVRRGVGVEAEATVRIGGISTRDRIRVTDWEPGRLLGIEHAGWVTGRGEIHLTRLAPDVTHIFWRERLEAPLGVIGAAALAAFAPAMRRIFRRDLRVLASMVRAGSSGAQRRATNSATT